MLWRYSCRVDWLFHEHKSVLQLLHEEVQNRKSFKSHELNFHKRKTNSKSSGGTSPWIFVGYRRHCWKILNRAKYHVFSCPSVCKCTVSTETALYQDILGKDVLLWGYVSFGGCNISIYHVFFTTALLLLISHSRYSSRQYSSCWSLTCDFPQCLRTFTGILIIFVALTKGKWKRSARSLDPLATFLHACGLLLELGLFSLPWQKENESDRPGL